MNKYLVRRLLTAAFTILGISLIIFAVLALAPGDPMAQYGANPAVPAYVRENIKKSLGLDQPWPVRYVKWVQSAASGDFGYSFTSRVPVTDLIWQRLPTTLWILGAAYLIAVLLALPIGVLSAVKQYSIFDHVASALAFIGYSLPTFFTGTFLIIVFGVYLRWLPFIYDSTLEVKDFASFVELLRQSAMPITVLGLFQTAALARFVRASMLENLPLDYVRTARAKGLAERVVVIRHVLRNSMLPVVTLIALGVPGIFGGAVITEQIFRVPGIGSMLIKGIETSDTPVVMAVTFISAVLVVMFNVVADIFYGFLDPRIQYK